MTTSIFTTWLNQLNNTMRFEQHRILMFVDNCAAHPDVQLSHVKLVFLPPNTTSKLQPCDAGVIQTVKMQVLHQMDVDETGTAPTLAKSVTVLDAIIWLKSAWDILQASTIVMCFRKCGFHTDTEGKFLINCNVTVFPTVLMHMFYYFNLQPCT